MVLLLEFTFTHSISGSHALTWLPEAEAPNNQNKKAYLSSHNLFVIPHNRPPGCLKPFCPYQAVFSSRPGVEMAEGGLWKSLSLEGILLIVVWLTSVACFLPFRVLSYSTNFWTVLILLPVLEAMESHWILMAANSVELEWSATK